MTAILFTLAILATIALCCYLIIDKINEWGKTIIDKVEDTYTDLYDNIDSNWRVIQEIKSDISCLPKREEEKEEEKLLDPRDQKHLPYVNPAWDDHPLYSIAKSLYSLNQYFTRNKE